MNKLLILQMLAASIVMFGFVMSLNSTPAPIDASGIATRQSVASESVLLSFLDQLKVEESAVKKETTIAFQQ